MFKSFTNSFTNSSGVKTPVAGPLRTAPVRKTAYDVWLPGNVTTFNPDAEEIGTDCIRKNTMSPAAPITPGRAGGGWLLRGPTYLIDKRKVEPEPCAFRPCGFSVLDVGDKSLQHLSHRILELHDFIKSHAESFFFVFCWQIKFGKKHVNVVNLFEKTLDKDSDPQFEKLLDSILNGTNEYRNNRMKFVCKVISAPMLMKKTLQSLGVQRPAIIGKKLKCAYFRGPNYFEVDCDVCSSQIARKILGLVYVVHLH